MAEECDVRLLTWPPDPVVLEHHGSDEAVQLRVTFDDEQPAAVVLRAGDEPLDVRMRLELSAARPVPLCIDVCRPLCATSDYTVGVTIFDRPVARISVVGTTRIERCTDRPEPVETCVSLAEGSTPEEGAAVVPAGEARLRALDGRLHARPSAEAGRVAVFFPDTGLRVQLPVPSHDVRLLLVNGGAPELAVRVLGDAGQLGVRADRVQGTGTVRVKEVGVTAVEIRGGNAEAGVLEVCWTPDQW
jgi:hypothetical protein